MDIDYLRSTLRYEAETGKMFWSIPRRTHNKGDEAGSLGTNGRVYITIDGKRYLRARLAWFHHYGRWPENTIEHRDLNRSNDRIKNLRDITLAQQQRNTTRGCGSYRPTNKGVNARVRINKIRYNVGTFPTQQDAELAVYIYLKENAS